MAGARLRRRVANDALIDIDTVRYSVPHRLVRDHVDVVDRRAEVRVFHGGGARRDARALDRAVRARRRPGALRGLWRRPAAETTAPRPRARGLGRDLADYAAVVGAVPHERDIHARVLEQLTRLRLAHVAERLDALLNDAARTEPTYLDFLDACSRQEIEAKQRKRVAMGLKIAHFPAVKTLDDFDFKFQPSVDQQLVRELAISRYIANAENVLSSARPASARRISRSRSAAPSSRPATPCSSRARPRCWPRSPKRKPRAS